MDYFAIHDRQWNSVFNKATSKARKRAYLITPFMQKTCVEELLGANPIEVKVITRFNLNDFNKGVSDINAIEYLLNVGAQIKGIKNLHSKVYIFDSNQAIVTSANLTQAALYRNHEFGVISENSEFLEAVNSYFHQLWKQAGDDILDKTTLNKWKLEIDKQRANSSGAIDKSKLGDYGADLKYKEAENGEDTKSFDKKLPQQYFIKFSAISSDRSLRNMSTRDAVNESLSHICLSYPRERRPRRVMDGDILYVSRLVKEPNDIIIFGRVQGLSYVKGRDDANSEDIKKRGWRKTWPHYIRVYNPTFIKGTLNDGISMYKLMEDLGADSFVSTYENALRGQGNTNPRLAYMQKAAVQLTPTAAYYLNTHFDKLVDKLGLCSEKDFVNY